MKIEILDTTLRDGVQAEGISFSKEDKLAVLKLLDGFELDFAEGGSPASNPKDAAFFNEAKKISLNYCKLVAFGSTVHKNSVASEDKTLATLIEAGTEYISIFGKSSIMHVKEVLNVTPAQNLKMIGDTVGFLTKLGKKVLFDAEHFFDGYLLDADYAMSALKAAYDNGADRLILCDTNGGNFPETVYDITKKVVEAFPSAIIGIHCHNDTGLAVANSLAAVNAGAKHIQGTFIGFGERCGNANLSCIIADLQLKLNLQIVSAETLKNLTATARAIAEIANISLHKNLPYIGGSAFSHKAGTHADGVFKNSAAFEHVNPELVGNTRKFLLSEVSGRSAVLKKLEAVYPSIGRDSAEASDILAKIKSLESQGYQFESADASFYILVQKLLGKYKPHFELINFKVINEQPPIEGTVATAFIKIRVGNGVSIATAEGDGPVHALDKALRQALGDFYPEINEISLTDYKVRVINSEAATAAQVRVLITSSNGREIWSTIGVSADIIEASWQALLDSMEYRLTKDFK